MQTRLNARVGVFSIILAAVFVWVSADMADARVNHVKKKNIPTEHSTSRKAKSTKRAPAPVAVHQSAELKTWLKQLKADAVKAGIPTALVDRSLKNFTPSERVLELDQKQPESTFTFSEYLERVISDAKVNTGIEKYAANREMLNKIGAEFGIQPQFIVALWGIESNYGQNTGGFDIVPALATLAYDGRRSEFFRAELMNAFRILKEGHISLENMKGSWAGAMGQCQFMPSSFLSFAIDYNGDGRSDIWNTRSDIFASIANYLVQSGWDSSYGWGMAVAIPANFDTSQASLKIDKPMAEWSRMGVTQPNGSKLPASKLRVSLILPEEGDESIAYLVTSNYKTIMKWNRSTYFATAVGLLADQIAE